MSHFGKLELDHFDRDMFAETVMNYWRRGAWYSFGGEGVGNTIDCSGLVMQGLKTIGFYRRRVDRRARDIFADLRSLDREIDPGKLCPDCLVFWGPINHPERIRHVDVYIGHGRTLGASGGGSNVRTLADAIAKNAFVKIRPIADPRSGEQIWAADPFKIPDESP